MRTKTLLLTAALSAAGIATSMAQTTPVYSVNAVGYVNTSLVPGFQIISNPLKATSNKTADLLAAAPNITKVYKYDSTTGQFEINQKTFGTWSLPNQTLVPGEAAFVSVPSAVTITFVGDVPQGLANELDNPIPAGFSLKSSTVPKAGRLQTDLGYPAANNDKVYVFNTATQNYDTYSYLFGNWQGAGEPSIAVGQGFFVNKAAAANWHVTFSVSQ